MVQDIGLSNINDVLEPTRAKNVLDIVLTSQKEIVDNVKTRKPLGSSEHIYSLWSKQKENGIDKCGTRNNFYFHKGS